MKKKINKDDGHGNISNINSMEICNNISKYSKQRKEKKSQILKKLDKLNLTEGLEDHINENIQKLYECEKSHILTPSEYDIQLKEVNKKSDELDNKENKQESNICNTTINDEIVSIIANSNLDIIRNEDCADIITNKDKLNTNIIISDLLINISDKLDLIINYVSNNKNKTNINEMNLFELDKTRKLANDIIVLNNYPGGDKVASSKLAYLKNRIDEEINKRLLIL